jgi:hypothetical protein
MVEEGKLILDRLLSVTPLEDLQFKAPLISDDDPIITYLDTSDFSALPAKEELLQLTAPGIGSKNEMRSHSISLVTRRRSLQRRHWELIKGSCLQHKGSQIWACWKDLEEFMASKENLLELSTIISRNWSTVVDEDGSYIWIYLDSKIICCCLQGFSFQTVCYNPRVGLNILLFDEASDIDM